MSPIMYSSVYINPISYGVISSIIIITYGEIISHL
nr:MAG TPA: hypothetical protein [Crassvirales sp.]